MANAAASPAATDPWAQFNPTSLPPAGGADPWVDFNPIAAPSSLQSEFSDLQKGGTQGVIDIGAGGAQLLDRLGVPGTNVDQYIASHEKAPAGSGPAFNVGRFVGNAAAGAPITYMVPGATAESLGARVAANAAGGALTGALQPVNPSDPNYWTTKAEQGGAGAAGGAIAAPGMGGAARVISPNVNPNVKLLLNEGVTPTMGQIVGGWFKDLEDKLTSFPGFGDAIKAAKARAVGDLNTAAINRSLSHVGESLDPGTAPGRAAVDQMHSKIEDGYKQLLPHVTWQIDPQFVQGVTAVRTNANLLPDQAAKFDALLKSQLSKVSGGVLPGPTYKDVESKLGQTATDYIHSSDPDDRAVGRALIGVQGQFKAALARSNPQYATRLNALDAAYADSLRVEGAASGQGAKEGVFSAPQLSASVRALDPSLRHGAFGRGEARMQDLSDAGKAVLGYNVPDSGTAGRLYANAGLLGLAGSAVGELAHLPPKVVLPALATGAAGVTSYSRPAQATLAALLARRPDVAAPIASVVRKATPAATSGLAGVLARNVANP